MNSMAAMEAIFLTFFQTWDTVALLSLGKTDIVKSAPNSSLCGKLLYVTVSAYADPVCPSDFMTSVLCQS